MQDATLINRIDIDEVLVLSPTAFIAVVAKDPTLLDDPRLRARHHVTRQLQRV